VILLTDGYSKEKVLECMFDPEISEILAELQVESKDAGLLAAKFAITEDEIRNQLSYLLQHDFVLEERKDNKILYSVDAKKLSQVMEDAHNFKNIDDGLAKMDSFLN